MPHHHSQVQFEGCFTKWQGARRAIIGCAGARRLQTAVLALSGRGASAWPLAGAAMAALTIALLTPGQMGAQTPSPASPSGQTTAPAFRVMSVTDPSYQAQMTSISEARRLLSLGDLTNAVPLLTGFCAKYPDNSDGHFWLAVTYKQMNNLPAAEKEYADALNSAKSDGLDSAELRNNLGNLLIELGFIKEAEYDFRRALEIDPDLAPVHENLGRLFLIQSRYSEALQELNTEALSNNMTGRLCLWRALAYMGLADQGKANSWLAKCIELSSASHDPADGQIGQKARQLRQMLGQ